jgi:hypothetical protein
MQRFLSLAILTILGVGFAEAQALKDNFDGKVLDKAKWTFKQVLDDQITFPAAGRCGVGVEITVRERDGGRQCDTDCQRAEVRTIRSSWPIFGDEVWYRFSFKVSGDIAEIGSRRFVIGQWKGPGDGSPMLAQRFDNGIFHITVQDNDVRYVIASAAGNPNAIVSAQQELAGQEPAELLEDLPTTAAYSPTSGRYRGDSHIKIIPEPNAVLPDPRKGWVDMIYRVRPGRMDNEYGPRQLGEIDVWANGMKIVSVRGNIGATLKKKNPLSLQGPYFKFGIYRLRQPGLVRFSLDEFSQGPTQDTLSGLCKTNPTAIKE